LGHPLQRGARAPDHAVVRDVGRAPVLVGLDVEELRVDRGHCVVDPYVDRAELVFSRLRSSLDLVGVGDVGGEDESFSAQLLDLCRRALEPRIAAGQERDSGAVLRKPARSRAADPSGGTRDYDDVTHVLALPTRRRSQTFPTSRAPPRYRRRSARTPARPAGPGTEPTAPRSGRQYSVHAARGG